MNKSKRNFLFLLLMVITSACSNEESIEGRWVQPIPGQSNNYQGFVLESTGKASSINMSTLVYEAWKRQGNQLILLGKSVGNRQVMHFTDTFEIKKVTTDSLVLAKKRFVLRYAKEKITE